MSILIQPGHSYQLKPLGPVFSSEIYIATVLYIEVNGLISYGFRYKHENKINDTVKCPLSDFVLMIDKEVEPQTSESDGNSRRNLQRWSQ